MRYIALRFSASLRLCVEIFTPSQFLPSTLIKATALAAYWCQALRRAPVGS